MADVERFKEMRRAHANEQAYEELNRSNEFLGQAPPAPSSSPRRSSANANANANANNKPRKWGKPMSPEQYRPDDWLGSPSSGRRKSYKVKNVSNVMPPVVNLDHGDNEHYLAAPHHAQEVAVQPAPTSPKQEDDDDDSIEFVETETKLSSSSSSPKNRNKKKTDHDDGVDRPDPAKFKAMMRNSNSNNVYEELNRSHEFLGQANASPVSPFRKKQTENKTHKWGPPASPEQFRPDDWLGSPSSAERKSYKVKNHVANIMPIVNLDDDADRHQQPRDARDKPKPKAPSTKKPATTVEKSPKVSPKPSSKKATTTNNINSNSNKTAANNDDDDDDKPDPEKYKAMMRASAAFDEMNSSQRSEEGFLGAQAPRSPVRHSAARKWGKPASSAGDSNSPKKPSDVSNSPRRDHSHHSPKQNKGDQMAKPPLSLKRDSSAAPTTTSSGSVPTVLRHTMPACPPRVKSSAKERAKEGSPISVKEKVDRNKFMSSFSAFEGNDGQVQVPAAFAHLRSPGALVNTKHKQRNTTHLYTPPRGGSRSSTRATTAGISRLPFDTSQHSSRESSGAELKQLDSIIGRLRKVSVDPSKMKKTTNAATADKSDQHASEIMQMLRHLQSKRGPGMDGVEVFHRIMKGVKRNGVLELHLEAEEMSEIDDIIQRIQKFHVGLGDHEQAHGEIKLLLRRLCKVTPASGNAPDTIAGAITRLKKVIPRLSDEDQSEAEDARKRLKSVNTKLHQREEEELANVIRNLEDDDLIGSERLDELTRVLAALDSIGGGDGGSFAGFVDAFDDMNASTSSIGSSASALRRSTVISPKQAVQRNFKVSSSARAKSLAISMEPLDSSIHDEGSGLANLRSMIRNLRKVTPKKKSDGDTSDQHASEILEIMRQLNCVEQEAAKKGDGNNGAETLYDLLANLRQQGVLTSHMDKEKMEKLQDAIQRLEKVRIRLDDREHYHGEVGGVIRNLRKITPISAHVPETIQSAIARLKKVVPKLFDDDKDETEDVIDRLHRLVSKLEQEEEEDLANAIRNLDQKSIDESTHSGSNAGMDTLMRVLAGLGSLGDADDYKRMSLAAARLSTEDADYLASAIRRLKKANLTHREAEACAGLVRNLKKLDTSEDEIESDESIVRLRNAMDSTRKANEIASVLKGLRRLDMTKEETTDLAGIIVTLGKGSDKYRDEIADAISRLKKAKLNKWEANEVAGIMFNLRKTKFNKHTDKKEPPGLVKLRKVVTKEKCDMVAEVLHSLRSVDVNDQEADQFAEAVADLGGDEPGAGDDHQLMSVVYDEGEPQMVLNIPSGENAEEAFELNFSESAPIPVQMKEAHIETPVVEVEEEPQGMHLAFARSGHVADVNLEDEEPEKNIVFMQKHHWRYKKHNTTIVSEKRWRYNEGFNVDEVIYSPLTRDQHDRRKTIGASILGAMGDSPLDAFDDEGGMDDHQDVNVEDGNMTKKKNGKNKRASMV